MLDWFYNCRKREREDKRAVHNFSNKVLELLQTFGVSLVRSHIRFEVFLSEQ